MNLTERLRERGYDLKTAACALRAIVRNPDDLPQVFTIIDSMSGKTAHHMAARLRRAPGGAALIAKGNHLADVLRDRAALRRLPAGSLGRAYLDFVESEGISAEGLLDAAARGRLDTERTPDEDFIHTRLRDSHDLWHALTGYHGDIVGEIALLAFTGAQTKNPAVAAIVLVAVAKGLVRGHVGLVLDGFRRGRDAAWLTAVDWEALLARPVAELRGELRVGAPRVYTPVRSDDLREAGIISKAA